MRLLLLALLSHLAPVLFAQRSGIGIKGGPLMSGTKSATLAANWIPGASIGAYFALRAGPRMELQPELLLTSLGAGYSMPDGERSKVRTLYAQVPLSFKVYLSNVVNLQAGAQMGRLLLAQQISPEGSSDVTSSHEHWDYGVILGAGADLVSGVDLGLRYYSGLRPVLSDDQAYFPRNRSMALSLGYRMGRLRAPKFNRKRH
ncbi:MAG: PorT family protein [Flavobacteriales bacterium]|nr:PorT family protein [Flavobacteriales bacterium]